MSWPLTEWPLGSADGLPLSESDCLLLLDTDLIDTDGDLLRSFPCPAAKFEAELCSSGAEDDGCAGLLYPPSPLELKPTRAQLASDLLHQLDNQCKTESFPSWLEEKVDLPIFEAIPAAAAGERAPYAAPPPPPPAAHAHRSDTAELLREFESVYSDVELTHLTPPQSPPGPATQLLLTYAQQAQAWPPHAPPPPPPHDLEREMAVVEELMRHSAAQLASPAYSSSPPPSPAPSGSSSASSSADEEWSARSPRARPYARGPDDRRSRKKEQNKNAATRYRQKKKAEVEVLLSEESGLRQRHGELDTKCADLQREIRYLKGLMRDLFKAKGLIK